MGKFVLDLPIYSNQIYEVCMKKINIKKHIDFHFYEIAKVLHVGIYQYTTRMDHSKKNIAIRILKKRV